MDEGILQPGVNWMRERCVDYAVLGGSGCVAAGDAEFVAAGGAAGLLLVLCFVCECGAGFFGIPIGWDVAGGGIYCAIFRAARLAAPTGGAESAFAGEPFPAAVGGVWDLF